MSSNTEALLMQEGLLIPLMLYEKYPIFGKDIVISSSFELFNKHDRLLMVTDNDDTLVGDNLQASLLQWPQKEVIIVHK